MKTTAPAPPCEQQWLPLASSGSLYVSNGIPRIVALTEEAEDDPSLRREIEMLTGCSVVIEARVSVAGNSLGFTHAALIVPARVRPLRKRRPMIPRVTRRASR